MMFTFIRYVHNIFLATTTSYFTYMKRFGYLGSKKRVDISLLRLQRTMYVEVFLELDWSCMVTYKHEYVVSTLYHCRHLVSKSF